MLTLYYSPHMTSVDNESRRASGHADIPLSPLGKQHAQKLGQHYAAEVLDAIFCSDLQRALTTAQIAFEARQIPIIPDARLREYDYGELTQHPLSEVEKEFPQRIIEPFPGGESLVMVVERVGAFLREVSPKYEAETIVVIGHRATKYALEYWCGDRTLDEIVRTPWEWRDIPIWRYALSAQMLARRPLVS